IMKNSLGIQLLVEKTRKSISKSPLEKGCFIGRREGLDIRVGPNSVDRALRIMDTLINALEVKGAKVSITKKDYYRNSTCVNLSGVNLEFDIYEKTNIIKKSQDKFGYNQLDYVPNGELVLRIKNTYSNRSEWKDGSRKKLEDQIDSFIEGLYAAVAKEKELQKERDKWKEDQKKIEESDRLREIEQERVKNLEKEALCWQKSQIIRSYVEAATKTYIQNNGNIEAGSEFKNWKDWAKQQADRLDPLLDSLILARSEAVKN
ncbi:MAG: hypothetical protein NTZ63_06795, partial [Candidatus Omnitrophica bacterium]|nr:hypothetical protein [Candidatus Omnitrophota bacterium]